MQLADACHAILIQLSSVVEQLDEKDFIKPSPTLSHSTIGQHLRHTLEFFICLESGFARGVVNYDERSHDKLIETDKYIALGTIHRIREFIARQTDDQPMKLEVGYAADSHACITLDTNYRRELTYNIEHAVHHMAIMKIGLREVAPYVSFPADFGVAVSTLRYREAITSSH